MTEQVVSKLRDFRVTFVGMIFVKRTPRQLPESCRYSASVLLLIALLCLAVFPVVAQKTTQPNAAENQQILGKFSRYLHYTMEQGLSSNWIKDVAQDDDGFLWFGTEEGLNRFDGEHFTPFFYSADQKGLPNDHITALLAIPGHRLLVGTENGFCVVNTRHLVFEPVSLPAEAPFLKTGIIVGKIHLARNGQIWVGANSGVYLLDEQLHLLQSFLTPLKSGVNPNVNFALDFLELPDGDVAVKFTQNLYPYYLPWQIIDFQNQKMEPLSSRKPAYKPLDDALQAACIAPDAQGNIWYTDLGASNPIALFRYDNVQHSAQGLLPNTAIRTDKPHLGQFHHPFILPDSLIFLQRYFGSPLVYDFKSGTTTDLPTWKVSTPDGKTIVNFLDRDNNLWLCPRFEGIYFLPLKTLPATPMTALNAAHKKMMDKVGVSEEWFGFVGAECAGKWIISSPNGGLYAMDKSGMGVTGEVLSNPFEGYAYVSEFASYRGDTLWTNALNGLYWYDPISNTQGILKAKIKGLDSLDSRFIYRDHHGLIWGRVRSNGVCCFDTRNRRLIHFPSLGKNAVYPILSATACTEGPDGDMWFSYGNEEKYLVRWRRASGTFEKVAPQPLQGISPSKAFILLADPLGNLWLNVEQQWYVMDTRTNQVRHFGKENGLVTNSPGGTCLDRDGNVWFATSFGLSRYDTRTSQLRTFYQTDGLLSNIIVNVELIDTARNILLVSTDRGLCLFEPGKVAVAAPAPPTFITGLRVSDKITPLPESGLLKLPFDDNDLRIEFTGVNFINGPSNRYQYSMELEGSPANWEETGTDNFANFLNLAPGKYQFRARTANSDGVWGSEEATLDIIIYPPWWQTWTFQISLLAGLLLFGWWFYRRQIVRTQHREKEKAQVRQQLADLEMKALRSQMNPHFVFNALNSVQNFILKNDTREASRYLTKFARLMRLILENSESPMVPLAREIELLRYYTELEQLRFHHRFTFTFEIDPALNPEQVSIPGMLIQPHIENAIWHGLMHKTDAGKLSVRFLKVGEKTLVCEIEDDGVGRARAAEIEKDRPKAHRSTGLANTQHRLDLLNAQLAEDIRLDFEDLHDATGAPRGTKVVVRMPIL